MNADERQKIRDEIQDLLLTQLRDGLQNQSLEAADLKIYYGLKLAEEAAELAEKEFQEKSNGQFEPLSPEEVKRGFSVMLGKEYVP